MTIHLLDVASQYWARKNEALVAHRTVEQVKRYGAKHFDPKAFSYWTGWA
jgi:hypothetical protein